MNRFQFVTLLLWLLWIRPVSAQWRLLYKSQDVLQTPDPPAADSLDPIVLIEPRGKLSKYLVVHYAHAKRKLVPTKQVWGFTDSTGAIWRDDHNDLCRVLNYGGNWVEYLIYRTRISGRGQPIVYYELGYSRSLDSKVRLSWAEAMADIPYNFREGQGHP